MSIANSANVLETIKAATDFSHAEQLTLLIYQLLKKTGLNLKLLSAVAVSQGPGSYTGLRIAAGGSVIGAIVGDFFFRKGSIGIGRLIDNYQKDGLRTAELFATAIVSSLFGIAIFVVFGVIGNRVLRTWHDSAARDI